MAEPINHDSPWKETLDRFLRPFLELTFPSITRHIDWSVDPISLEQEFREIAPDAELGPLRADKLIKVRLLNGTDQWLLIHIEVQMQYDPKLPRRIFDYCCRIHSRYKIPVVPLVILGDTRRSWRPTTYSGGFGKLGLSIRFATCKVSDFKGRLEDRHHRDNLTIFIIAAHLGTQKHRRDPASLSECRLELTQELYARGYTQEDLRSLVFLIDWLMPLPAEHKVQFRKRLQQLQKENPMPHVTLFEELSREEGRQEGRQRSILELLETRFGEVPVIIRDRVRAVHDEAQLQKMLCRAAVIPGLEEF
jgi:hypothetical protein